MSDDRNAARAIAEEFALWLTQTQSARAVSAYYAAIVEADSFLLERNLSKRSLFLLNKKSVVSLLTTLRGNRIFRNQATVSLMNLQKATALLGDFIEERDKRIVDKLLSAFESDSEEKKEIASEIDSKEEVQPPVSSVSKESMFVFDGTDLLTAVIDNKLDYVDHLAADGAFWIIGGRELEPFVAMAKEKGYLFTFKPDGSRSSVGRPCWWYKPAKQTETLSIVEPSYFDGVLDDTRYAPLRDALVKEGITDLEDLRNIKLWMFMNSHRLYTIQTRLAISSELHDKLRGTDVAPDVTANCAICILNKEFKGATPSDAFAALMDYVATKYPLKFRSICGAIHPKTMKVVLRRNDYDGSKIKLMNPEIYIDRDLTKKQIETYIDWVFTKCTGCVPAYSVVCMEAKPVESLPTAEPVATEEPVPTVEPMPTVGPVATAEPAATEGLVPTVEPMATEEPVPTVEPVPMTAGYVSKAFPNPPPYFVGKVEDCLLAADLEGLSLDDLQVELNSTIVGTKEAIAQSPNIIELDRRFYHQDAFVDFEEGADAMADILRKLIKRNNGVVSTKKLAEYVRAEMQMFLNDNGLTSEQQIVDFAYHLFDKVEYKGIHYVFKGNMYISAPGIEMETFIDVVRNFALTVSSTVTHDEIREYVTKAGLSADNIRGKMKINAAPDFLVYDENEYLLSESMHIDNAFLDKAKSALNRLFADVGDHIILRSIAPGWYSLLPDLPYGLSWTPMLLQQVIRYWGKRLGAHTIQAMDSQDSNAVHAMLVSEDSMIQDFRDAVAVYLSEEMPDRERYEAEELRGILVNAAMLQGNELIWNMHKALSQDPRFIWSGDNQSVRVVLQ